MPRARATSAELKYAALALVLLTCAGCSRAVPASATRSEHERSGDVKIAPATTTRDPVDDAVAAARKLDEPNAMLALDTLREQLPDADAHKSTVSCELAVLLNNRALRTFDAEARSAEKDARRAVSLCAANAQLQTNLSRLLTSRAVMEDKKTSEGRARARAFLDDAIKIDAKNVAALRSLGEIAFLDDDFKAAIDAYRAAVALDPSLAPRLAEIEKKAAVEGGFRDQREGHFVARFEGYAQESLSWTALDSLERSYFAVGRVLDVYPREAITVVIYTGDQYKTAVDAPDWSDGLFDGKIRVREGNLTAQNGTLDRLLRHEYVHAALGSLRTPIPAWFHEGLAMNLEGDVLEPRPVERTLSYEQLEQSFTKLDADNAHVAYAMATEIVRGLVERNSDLRELMSRMKNGEGFAPAFRRAYGVDARAYVETWVQSR